LVKKSIVLHAGDNSDLQIVLNEDAAALTENVTVTTEPFETTDSSAINQQLLNKRELQQLSSVLLNDRFARRRRCPGSPRTMTFAANSQCAAPALIASGCTSTEC
jgi:hypothetical protein